MKDYLVKRRRAIILLVILLVSGFFIWLIYSNKTKTIPVPTPTPVKFELIKMSPQDKSSNIFPSTTAIEFYFTKPIDVSTLVLNSKPITNLQFETDTNDEILFVRSVGGWKIGVEYTISLSVESKAGEKLDNPITLTFKTSLPKTSTLDEVPR